MTNSTANEAVYLGALRQVLTLGEDKEDRTGTGTTSIFGGVYMRFDLMDGFPLLTTKSVHWKSVWRELRWFLDGSNNVEELEADGVRIWTPWKREDGTIGVGTYGEGWRKYPSVNEAGEVVYIDQIADVLWQLRNMPDSRRMMVNAWNPGRAHSAALPPCHYGFQLYSYASSAGGMRFLDLSYSMRSNDLFLGAPFNIASYAALLHIIAAAVDMVPRYLIHNVPGDAHIYDNHVEAVEQQLSRDIRSSPRIIVDRDLVRETLANRLPLSGLAEDALLIQDYNPHPAIKAPVAV